MCRQPRTALWGVLVGAGTGIIRFDNRRLLFTYYGLRGLSLLFLPYGFAPQSHGLSIFAVFYGLDWIATVTIWRSSCRARSAS